jgi:hypothetical protein
MTGPRKTLESERQSSHSGRFLLAVAVGTMSADVHKQVEVLCVEQTVEPGLLNEV